MDNITIHRDIKARDGEAAMAQIGTTAQMDIERGLNGHHPPHTHIFIEYKHTQHTMCITRNNRKHHQNIHHINVHNKYSWSERNSQALKSHYFLGKRRKRMMMSLYSVCCFLSFQPVSKGGLFSSFFQTLFHHGPIIVFPVHSVTHQLTNSLLQSNQKQQIRILNC